MLGCDIDGCLLCIVTPLVNSIYRRCGIRIRVPEIRSFEIEKGFDVPKDIVKAAVTEVVTNINIPSYKGAVGCLADYSNTTKNKLIFITTRSANAEASTRTILDKFGFEYELYMTDDKASVINQCGISIFIEDRAKIARQIAENSRCKVLLINRPWNEHLDTSLYPQITRVKGWKEIRRIINNVNTFS